MLKEDDMFKDFAARSPSASITDEDSNVWPQHLDESREPFIFVPLYPADTHSYLQQATDCVLFVTLTSRVEVEMESRNRCWF